MTQPIVRKVSGRRFLALLPLCLLVLAGGTVAQEYPAKPIRVIVANAPGSVVDVIARLVATHMSAALGQAMVIENVAGAGGVVGTEMLARAPRDGYTLGMVASNFVINPSLYKLTYDPLQSITPVSILATTPMVLVVNPSVPAKSVKELVSLAKANPGAVTFGSAGSGTAGHLSAELLGSMADFRWLHVPYKGNNQFTTDLLGGQIQAGFLGGAAAVPHVKAGKLRALAVTTPNRSSGLPDVPSLAEAGIAGYSLDSWVALIAPSGVPAPVMQKLQDAAVRAMKTKEVQDLLQSQSVDVIASTSDAAAAVFASDLAKYSKLIRDAGIKAE